jgi:hypothetical protein
MSAAIAKLYSYIVRPATHHKASSEGIRAVIDAKTIVAE